jgi:hypothetical protein
MRSCPPNHSKRGIAALVLAAAFHLGCAGMSVGPVSAGRFDYFAAPEPRDPWTPKIAVWQARESAVPATDSLATPGSVSDGGAVKPASGTRGDLRRKYFEFRREWKRQMAKDVAKWIQSEARDHYVPDGPIDHWATLEETLDRNGDDCDGLELLVYHFLRDLGFEDDEVFRAIVYRPGDGQHHMVTLWFDTPGDPFVIDPTGAMTSGMPRMSQVPGWVPLKIFSEDGEWSATPLAANAPSR